MNRGIGVDICDNRRLQKILGQYNERFLSRVFIPDEVAYCMSKANPAPFLAARFAFKEAFFKALSQPDFRMKFKDIGLTGSTGKKEIFTSPELEKYLKGTGISNIQYSISHEHNYSIAMVLLEGA